jgi:hypothetical protein
MRKLCNAGFGVRYVRIRFSQMFPHRRFVHQTTVRSRDAPGAPTNMIFSLSFERLMTHRTAALSSLNLFAI